MTISVGLAYLLSGIAHWYVGGSDREIIAPIELGTAAILLGGTVIRIVMGYPADRPQARTILLVGVILLNNFVFHEVHPESRFTPVLYLVTLGLGLVAALPTRTFVGLVGATVLVFAAIVTRSPDSASEWIEASLILIASTVVAVVARSLQAGFSNRIRELQEANDQSIAALDNSLTQFREIADMASDLIAEIDDKGTILYANPAHDRFFEMKSADMVGRSALSLIGTETVDTTPLSMDGLLSAPIGPIAVQLSGRPSADGGRITVEMSSHPFINAQGERRVVVSSRDVTARIRAENEREEYRRELEAQVKARTNELTQSVNELQRHERLASVGTLAAGIAHQINNPIGGILLSSEFAIRSEAEGEADSSLLVDALKSNAEEAKRCGRIIKNLLRFARNDSADRVALDLAEVVERVVDLCRPYATSRRATLISNISAQPPALVVGHSVEIEESIVNLIRNAVEAGDETTHVQVSLLRDEETTTLVIEDDGRGMSPDDQKHVFDPFYTTRLNEGGTGLGLSVARDIALDHGGSLTVESSEGQGMSMRFTLPLASEHALADAADPKSPGQRTMDSANRRPKPGAKPVTPSPTP